LKNTLTGIITAALLTAGAGGTIAVASSTGGGTVSTVTAAKVDSPGKHCGDRNHIGKRQATTGSADPDETACTGARQP
jgi:Na+-transporting NADH:ubiquinone oxidoreductase subunit NqrF